MAVTAMYKVEDYNPEDGDWFWAKYGPEGKVTAAGRVKSCINGHHTVGVSKDFIFVYQELRLLRKGHR
jgi:hypothetical protein